MTADTLKRPMTESERALAAQYHNLIYRVIADCHLQDDAAADVYGEAALGLMLAAQKYVQYEELQKHRFSTIAYSCIRNALLRQRRRIAKRPQILSMDAKMGNGVTLYDVLPDTQYVDPAKQVVDFASRAVRSRKIYWAPAKEAA